MSGEAVEEGINTGTDGAHTHTHRALVTTKFRAVYPQDAARTGKPAF